MSEITINTSEIISQIDVNEYYDSLGSLDKEVLVGLLVAEGFIDKNTASLSASDISIDMLVEAHNNLWKLSLQEKAIFEKIVHKLNP